jgi:hypothetical protein
MRWQLHFFLSMKRGNCSIKNKTNDRPNWKAKQ